MNKRIDINCDMGESFGIYKIGNDETLMSLITQANIACGFHGSDPNHMRKTVALAKKHGVKVGAHFSLPDLNGFGRREMKIEKEELINIIMYQVGALKGFMDMYNVELNHLKPHGALYGMAAQYKHIAEGIAEVASFFKTTVFGMPGTCHETVYKSYNLHFSREFFADLEYRGDGSLIIARHHKSIDPEIAVKRCLQMLNDRTITCDDGSTIEMDADTICIHSDTPNSVDIARSINRALAPYLSLD